MEQAQEPGSCGSGTLSAPAWSVAARVEVAAGGVAGGWGQQSPAQVPLGEPGKSSGGCPLAPLFLPVFLWADPEPLLKAQSAVLEPPASHQSPRQAATSQSSRGRPQESGAYRFPEQG